MNKENHYGPQTFLWCFCLVLSLSIMLIIYCAKKMEEEGGKINIQVPPYLYTFYYLKWKRFISSQFLSSMFVIFFVK